MKKSKFVIVLIPLSILLMIVFTSCRIGGIRWFLNNFNANEAADSTCKKIVDAVDQRDVAALIATFPEASQSDSLSHDASILMNYICGNIISYSSAADGGVSTGGEQREGKCRVEINFSFSVTTTETKYHISVIECILDDFNGSIGVLSINVIEASNWQKDYVYRSKAEGINIDYGVGASCKRYYSLLDMG